MRKTVYEMIFARLQQMGILNENGEMRDAYKKYSSSGLMDLHVNRLWDDHISLAHTGIQNGDLMSDPDMEIQIFPAQKEAQALTFRNDYLGIYQEVYPEPGKYYPKLKTELNAFLNNWLKNMIEVQSYKLTESDKPEIR